MCLEAFEFAQVLSSFLLALKLKIRIEYFGSFFECNFHARNSCIKTRSSIENPRNFKSLNNICYGLEENIQTLKLDTYYLD